MLECCDIDTSASEARCCAEAAWLAFLTPLESCPAALLSGHLERRAVISFPRV
jgi:hypothetical protein